MENSTRKISGETGDAYGVTKKKSSSKSEEKHSKRTFFFTSKWHQVVKLGHSVPQQAREGGKKIIHCLLW